MPTFVHNTIVIVAEHLALQCTQQVVCVDIL